MRRRLLRDRAHVTRLLVLSEVRARAPSKLAPVADALDVTTQAVSNYMRELQDDGFVARDEGTYRLTREGIQHLQEGLREIKRAVDDEVARVATVGTTAAVADAPLEAGHRVHLVLRDGVLTALPAHDADEADGSRGTVLHDAAAGDDVAVHDLEGVVDLEPGTVHLLRVPPAERGGSRAVDAHALADALGGDLPAPDRVAVLGVEARVLVRRAGLAVDADLAPAHAAHEAATLGLDVLLAVSGDRLKDALADLEQLADAALDPVPVEIHDPPEAPA